MSNLQMQIIEEALRLDVNERADIADILLRSIDAPDSDIDQAWADEAQKRVEFYKENKEKLIPSDEVFGRYGV
ncbi:MAG: addiction module protein [Sulfuricurvum sp.]|uniref:addiction module protein n=1 Tax=Sulfuricurvum sp. TaxID=2025608 RepID=UPI003D0F9DFF